jgi:hypothetical protein
LLNLPACPINPHVTLASSHFFSCAAPPHPSSCAPLHSRPLGVRATSKQDVSPYKGPQDEPSFQSVLAAQPPPSLCPSCLCPCLLCTALDLPASRLTFPLQAVLAQCRLPWPPSAALPLQCAAARNRERRRHTTDSRTAVET